MKRISGRQAFKNSLRYRDTTMNYMEKDFRDSKKKKSRIHGPRSIFMEKYKESGDIEEAKRALVDNGYKIELFSDPKKNITADDTFESWIIEEERNDDGR